jgi:hypothetical protein
MSRRCPWCCEALNRGDVAVCPHCERPLKDDTGAELRPVDLRYDRVEATQCQRYRSLQLVGAPIVAVIAIAMSLLHLAAVALAPLMALVHLVLVRLVLVRDAHRLLGPTRRRFNRWLARFGFLWIGVPGYALAATPVLGILAGVGTFVGLNAAVHGYARWSLERERLRQPLQTWEKFLLAVLAVATVVVLTVVVALTLLLGWSVAALIGWINAQSG